MFPEIDQNKTIQNVKNFLTHDLPRLEQTAGTFLNAVTVSGMPTGDHNTNTALDNMTRQVWAQEELNYIAHAFSGIDPTLEKLLKYRFIANMTWYAIANSLLISERTAQRKLTNALVAFAYGYHGTHPLLVEK